MAELQGLDELRRKLRTIPVDLEKKGFRSAMRKAAGVVKDAAADNAQQLDDPQTSESIRKNLFVKFSPRAYRENRDIKFRVGILGGAKNYANTRDNVRKGRAGKQFATGGDKGNPGGDTWYWRLLEFGTSKMRARPFMRRALMENQAKVMDVAQDELSKAIDKAVTKASKGT